MSNIDLELGKKVRNARVLRGLSQQALGASLGISFQQIQKYERGINRISASSLLRMAELLGLPITYFFQGKQNPSEPENSHRQVTELVKAYNAIPSKEVKAHIRELLHALGGVDSIEIPH